MRSTSILAVALLAVILVAGCSKEPDAALSGGAPEPRGGSFKPSPPGKYEYKTPPASTP